MAGLSVQEEIRIEPAGFGGRSWDHITKIRYSVFTEEQKVDPDHDLDGCDPDAFHVLAMVKNVPAGTGRMLEDGHIGRIAVLKSCRGRGVGRLIVVRLIARAGALGLKRVFLGAQRHAVPFYRDLGFTAFGDPYEEAGIDHVQMEKWITKT